MEKQETAKTIAGHDVKRVHEKISDYLVRSEYDSICVINTKTGMLYVDTDELHADWDWTGQEHDYYDARALLVETFLDDNDGKGFMHCSEIPYIVSSWKNKKFTVLCSILVRRNTDVTRNNGIFLIWIRKKT